MAWSFKTVFRTLFQKRDSVWPGFYGLAGLVCAFLGLAGMRYGAAFFYFPLALVCFSLIFHPTLFCWAIVASTFSIGASVVMAFTVKEVYLKGMNSGLFSDGVMIFSIFLIISIALALASLMARPCLKKDRKR